MQRKPSVVKRKCFICKGNFERAAGKNVKQLVNSYVLRKNAVTCSRICSRKYGQMSSKQAKEIKKDNEWQEVQA